MHEEYRGDNGPETVYESDSMAKTATALLIGVLENRGLVDLDTPIIEYGVVPQANWSKNANRTDWFPHVTTRHLLGQTTGVGEVKPGTQFTYDSDAYLQVDAPPPAPPTPPTPPPTHNRSAQPCTRYFLLHNFAI